MTKKTIIGILTTGSLFLGGQGVFATESEHVLVQKQFPKASKNFVIEKFDSKNSYFKGIYELSIPVGIPYYLPTKVDVNGNNSYKYKFESQNPPGDWEVNISNGEVVCGVEGTIKVWVYDEGNNLICIYLITAGGI